MPEHVFAHYARSLRAAFGRRKLADFSLRRAFERGQLQRGLWRSDDGSFGIPAPLQVVSGLWAGWERAS